MKRLTFFVLTLMLVNVLFSLTVPPLKSRINDYAQALTSKQKALLESMLTDVERRTSSQIVLLVIPTLENEILENYSMKVVDTWKVGQTDLDNGVLLLIAMKEKKIRIEVGYGLEGIITDLKSGFIIRNIVVPEFKKGNYYEGIAGGLNAISGLVTDEYVISDEELQKYQEDVKRKKGVSQVPVGLIIFLIMIVFGGFGKRRRLGFLPFLFLGSTLGGSSRSSGFGGFGGFSGGGGSFGGGGASGGW